MDKPWAVTVVAKDFNAAMEHLRRFNGIQRRGVPVVNRVSMEGHSPNLRVTYELAFYIIPGTEPPKEDPRIAGAAGTGGGGSAMGGGMTMGGGSAMMSRMMGSAAGRNSVGATGAASAPTGSSAGGGRSKAGSED
jgi:hypothetical protein